MYVVSCIERTRFRRIASKSRQKAKDILADLGQFNSKYKSLTMDNFETGFFPCYLGKSRKSKS